MMRFLKEIYERGGGSGRQNKIERGLALVLALVMMFVTCTESLPAFAMEEIGSDPVSSYSAETTSGHTAEAEVTEEDPSAEPQPEADAEEHLHSEAPEGDGIEPEQPSDPEPQERAAEKIEGEAYGLRFTLTFPEGTALPENTRLAIDSLPKTSEEFELSERLAEEEIKDRKGSRSFGDADFFLLTLVKPDNTVAELDANARMELVFKNEFQKEFNADLLDIVYFNNDILTDELSSGAADVLSSNLGHESENHLLTNPDVERYHDAEGVHVFFNIDKMYAVGVLYGQEKAPEAETENAPETTPGPEEEVSEESGKAAVPEEVVSEESGKATVPGEEESIESGKATVPGEDQSIETGKAKLPEDDKEDENVESGKAKLPDEDENVESGKAALPEEELNEESGKGTLPEEELSEESGKAAQPDEDGTNDSAEEKEDKEDKEDGIIESYKDGEDGLKNSTSEEKDQKDSDEDGLEEGTSEESGKAHTASDAEDEDDDKDVDKDTDRGKTDSDKTDLGTTDQEKNDQDESDLEKTGTEETDGEKAGSLEAGSEDAAPEGELDLEITDSGKATTVPSAPAPQPETEEIPVSGSKTVQVDDADYTVNVEYTEDASIPMGASFDAVAISDTESEEYQTFSEQAVAAVADNTEHEQENLQLMGLFDLTISNREGEVIEPDGSIWLRVNFGEELPEGTNVYAVHFPGASAGTEQLGGGEDTSAENGQPDEVVENNGGQDELSGNEPEELTDTPEDELGSDDTQTSSGTNNTPAPQEPAPQNNDVPEIPAEPEVIPVDYNEGVAEFATESLSVYAIVYSVTTTYKDFEGNNWKITATYGADTGIPADAELVVRELEANESEQYLAQAAEALGAESKTVNIVKAFDISLVKDGVEYHSTSGDVKVTMQLMDQDVTEDMQVVHMDDVAEVMETSVEGDTLSFTTDGFSVYVVAYTVDFHWGNYTYSIAGESEITLGELFERLGVTEITLADVADVSFTDPAYIEIEQTDSDWLLRSLAPFSTEEALVLTLKNGESVEIKVTDAVTLPVNGTWDNGSNGSGTWDVDENGVLTLSGTGKMIDYTRKDYWVKDTPWYIAGVMDQIVRIVVNDGITHLGTNTFTRAGSLTEIDASSCTTLIDAGNDLFKVDSGKSHLTSVDLSGNTKFTGFGTNAFQNVNTIQYLDISDTQLTNDILSNTTAGFGASKGKIATLKANNCANLTGNLDLSDYSSLTTLELSGCTGLTSLTVPSSVTSLDVSGCTGLTSLVVPNSVTSLDISGCTGLTVLDLSGNSALTSIDVSNNASLTALKLPASVTSLNVADCANLVIYFDGTSASLPENLIPASASSVCWGDYTYTIARNSTVTLDEIFDALSITAITDTEVDSISASDLNILEVSGLTVTNPNSFTEAQTLTLTLKNGMTGEIGVVCSSLEESDNLNDFLDGNTVYSCEGEAETYSMSVPSILKDGDVLNLTLSFSEIPEGQTGERQMALLAPMHYTFPEGLTVTDVPESVTLSIPSGGDTLSFDASVSLDREGGTGGQTLTITGNYGDQGTAVGASTTAGFTLPVTVQPATVPASYALGSGMTLSVDKPHNVKVSVTSANYDAANGTITYTAVVEAESEIDEVNITDLTEASSSLQFESGSYLYARGDVPEGAPAAQVNSENVKPGTSAAFDGFPVTVTNMLDGDTITLTYTAKVLKGSYNKDTQQTEVQNTVTISNSDPTNNPDDDSASVTTTVPYTPLTREYVSLSGSWAYWKVTVNPDGYMLNGGSALTLEDTFDDKTAGDAEQAIDYTSVTVNGSGVTYDYSSSTGTFVIPDNTPVTITYRTRVTAQPSEAVTFRGTAVLKDTGGDTIASATAGAVTEAVIIYPSASDVTGTDYMLKLFVYADGQMQQGIGGATFILLDANQRPLEYKAGTDKGQPVTFTTGSDGYVNIELRAEDGGVSIEKNTGYYLEMKQAVDGYQKDNTLYSFMITDDPTYETGGFYQYYNGDTMKVRLYPSSAGLSVSIRFSGSYALREDQKNNVTAVLQKWIDNGDGIDDDNDWVEVERHPYTDSESGTIRFNEVLYNAELVEQNIYRVVEENESPWDLPEDISLTTSYYCMVNAGESVPYTEPQEFLVDNADDSVSVVIDNRYEEPQLTIVKMDKHTGEDLPGAVFSVYKIVNGAESGEAVTTYTTDENGEIVICGGESYESETLYGIKETTAPEHYLLPLKEEWHYFYFCNDEYLELSILANLPEDATAINLTNSGDRITVDNQKETVTIPVMKLWQGEQWPGNAEVKVGLYQSVADSDPERVLKDGTPRQVTLTSAMPYNNTAFSNLPSRDDQGRNIVYTIKEESITGQNPLDAGYVPEYGISSSGVYIVRNKPAATLTVSKEWVDLSGDPVTDPSVLAAQSSVTFDVYRSTRKFEDIDPDDGFTNADMTVFAGTLTRVRENQSFGASDNWSLSINDLDKQDDLGNPYYYYILETVPSFGSELYEVDEDAGTVLIKNKLAPETVNLTVTKAALEGDPRPESLERDFEFTLKLKVDDTHPVRSWQVYTDTEHPENNLITDWNGEATFKLKPTNPATQSTEGASITLALPVGVTATFTEAYNPEYTIETSGPTDGTTDDNGRTFTYETRSTTGAVTLTYTNTLHVICKVVDDHNVPTPFESLKRALAFIRSNPDDFTAPWTIYMLEDYTIPATDIVEVQEGESLTLTTASTTDTLFPFNGEVETNRAVITRGEAGGSMLKNAGTLTLENVYLDGGNITATGDGGLVYSTGTLNLNDKTTLCNSAASGKGGAVYAEGTVNIVDGVAITGSSAPSASALYLKGTLNMTGGEIKENTGASDGAVVVESTGDLINLSGDPVIIGNTNTQGKAANLFIGVDSDNVVNVVTPGLTADAQIGVTAMDGHMLIGEQFATAEFGQTDNLNRFVNDVYGYRGKLKDGTSTNVVWDGLTVTIKKAVDPLGANPNDRFTITLSSLSIIMSTYVIDGTLDYTVTAARQSRPGRITLRNVKASDEIKISPLPVGEYTITEAESNYTPGYTLVETGSTDTPAPIEGGTFTADNDSTVTVTNTRKLASVKLTKTLDDRLAGDAAVPFDFTVKLIDADGTAFADFTLAEGVTTHANGVATFTMSPTDAIDAIQNFQVPVGAAMTVTETVNPNYRITASAKTMPTEGEGAAITDVDADNVNVFAFAVTEDGADIIFTNVRKMAEIELSKTLAGKVSKTEAFTFTLTLTNGAAPVANYIVYRDETNPENNITTDANGAATVTFTFGENETEAKSIPLTIPEGTKLIVMETEVKKNINGTEQPIYTTTYSVNGGAVSTGTTATIAAVSDSDKSIAFTNTRKMQTITVTNTVAGYAGNVVPFSYTATVTDGGENQDDYDANGFTDGVMTFELTTGQSQTLTVPYGATLTVAETFIVGYGTTVKRGGAAAVEALSDTFVVTADINPLLFTNSQLIGLRIVNNTSSMLENVKITVGKNNIYLVNENQTGQERISTNKTATISVEAGKTAILEIQHDTSVTAEQNYTVNGTAPAVGYYYTINNEPSFHEFADPAILRVYNTEDYVVKGKLRYSVNDSIVTFTEQPLVSFDSNGGSWTTEMDGYHDPDGNRKVYQKAVNSGETVARPTPDPVYPTAEGIAFLGWTTDEEYTKQDHSADTEIDPQKAYDFNKPVTAPVTLYAVWAKSARDERIVTVKNGLNTDVTVTVTLTNDDPSGSNYTLYEDTSDPANSIKTDENGTASFTLTAGASKNLTVPDGAKLVLSLESASLAVSSEYTLTASTDNKSHTVDSVDCDGTVTFIPGVCKITDSAGNILYKGDGTPAVYGTLSAAFTDYAGTLYTDATHTTAATQAAVKMLVDEYEISSKHTFPNKNMTLTTAGKDDADFPFLGIQDRSTLYRNSFTTDSLFAHTNASEITLTDIILDGRNVSVDAVNGGLINVNKSGAKLTVGTGVTMQNVVFADYGSNANGGAVYIENGTLAVNGGLFSNLNARQGGAIYAKSNALLSIEGTGICFENCSANASNGDGDGGAIYYNDKVNALTINGGQDKDNPGIVFDSCVAKGKTGSGGAIYVNTTSSQPVSISGCSFIECSAREETNTNAAYGGGGICADGISAVTVSYCSFVACDTLSRGGGVVVYVANGGEVSVNHSTFERCNCKGQGGGMAVYQPNQENSNVPKETDARALTKLSVNGCEFSNCSSGTNNGSGGAIQCYLPRMEFTDSTFTDCWAGKEGGAVNNYFGNGYTVVWPGTYMNMTGCTFIRCRAEDRYQAEQPQHYGGAVNTKVKTVTVSNSYFEDCVSTLREGGALHLGGQGGGSTATITGSTFKNCTAKTGGGAVLASTETLEVSDSFFYGCQAFGVPAANYVYNNNNKKNQNGGGAISHSENSRGTSTQKTTLITNCIFAADPNGGTDALSCSTATNGGAIWTRANTNVTLNNLTIENATAGNNGGGVYLDTAVTKATITGGSIKECQAVSGSAVYVGKNAATFSGDLEVSGNTVSDVNSGAIQTVNTGKLYFEGNVVVKQNTCSADFTYDHDVLMQKDGVDIIYTTANGLGATAKIGVYVSDPNNAYAKHGKEGQPFGTYVSSDFLDAFFNDRDSELYGCQMSSSDTKIYWGNYVCKITDADGNTLTRPNGRDAVYQRLSQALDEFTLVTGGSAVYIKMLIEDYTIRQTAAISNFPNANITLTTAATSDAEHPYRGTEGTVCTISRTSGTEQLFKLNNADAVFQLEGITLDGRNDKSTETGNRRLIEAVAGALVINGGTTLQYGAASNGGAIDAAAAAQVTVNGVYDSANKEPTVKFINCTATGNNSNRPNGGAIRAVNLNITNSSENTGEFGTAFINCSAYNGGAITSTGTSMAINGAFFDSCQTQSAGGAVYHNYSDANSTSTFKNCAFENCVTNGNTTWAHGGAIEARTAELSVEDCSFKNCSATSDGGAVYHGYVDGNNKPSGNREKTSIKNTTFDGCSTTGSDASYNYGGSVYTQAKTVEVIDSSFQNSTSANHGGALYCQSSVDGSEATISGTRFDNCSTSRSNGNGGAIYAKTKVLTLQKSSKAETTINSCKAPGCSGAVYMDTVSSTLNITDSTVISGCYAKEGGAIYLPANVTMNLINSPEFTQNGYTTQDGSIINATSGACIYLAEGSKINLKDSPKFSRNILPKLERITNGGTLDFVRQDIYMAGYNSDTAFATNAASIYVVGELKGDTIWIWPEMSPHRLPNEQFAKIADGVTVSPDSLSKLRNALADTVTHCSNGEYLAGVQVGTDTENVYWDKMYVVSFMKKDNKGITVPGAGFTLYTDSECTDSVATATSADGENDTDAQGTLLTRGMVEFTSIRIGAYYMKETNVPSSFKENNTTYLVLVGTPYLAPNENNRYLWEGDGPLNVSEAATLVQHHTTEAGKYYGIFPLDVKNKAVLRANLASSNVGIENIRNDYQAAFMKVDSSGNALPGAAFTIYSAILDSRGEPESFDDGYPKLMLWSRDGENYPAPVVSADDTVAFKDKDNNPLPKGMVYFRELPLGTYYLLETAYPDRNGSGRQTFYAESDRVFKLEIEEDENIETGTGPIKVTLSEWQPVSRTYVELDKDASGYYTVSNQEVVCKLTDANDKLLYVQGHQVWENKEESPFKYYPAIYTTLEEGFAAAQSGSFVDENGNPVTVNALKLKVLKDFTISNPVSYTSTRAITFTTAERTASEKDRYIFTTTRTSDTSRALISRAYNEDISTDINAGALITIGNGANMTLQNIRLNGQKTRYNGRALHVTNGALTILSNTRIENFKQEAQEAELQSTNKTNIKGGAILMDDATSLRIDGGYNRTAIFSNNMVANNQTEGESDGGAIAAGSSNTFSITNAQFTGNQATVAGTEKGKGGAVSINKTGEIQNVVFSNNKASNQGGALRIAENCELTVSNCTFSSNSAKNGGAVSVASGAKATLVNGTIRSNSAEENGGAFHVESTATAKGTLTINGGSIMSNTAKLGSAIYDQDYGIITINGSSITDNMANGTNGGAINVDGGNASLLFSGNLEVFNNVSTSNSNEQRNVVLSEDSTGVINTTGEGLTGGVIGVYVIDGQNLFDKHGIYNTPFGNYASESGNDRGKNLNVFVNDRCLVLRGESKDGTEDSLIYWQNVVCKLTTKDNDLLYQPVQIDVGGTKKTVYAPAVYATVKAGFDATKGSLYQKNGNSYDAYTDSLKLKMLQDYSLGAEEIIVYSTQRDLTLTTAESSLSTPTSEDVFIYVPSKETEEGSESREKATLKRNQSTASMFTVNTAGNFAISGIIIDGGAIINTETGRNSGLSTIIDGAIVNVAMGKLTVETGATLQNSVTTGNGGAVYVASNATMELSGGTISGNEASNGGAVYVASDAIMVLKDGTNDAHATIKDNLASTSGAGIYLKKGSTLNLSGNPDFGGAGATSTAIDSTVGNFAIGENLPSNAKNGQLDYTKARQDIYLEGAAEEDQALTSITLTGNLADTVPAGSIWVWAEGENHYYMLKQFAVLADTFTGTVTDTTYNAFRNARADAHTDCGGDYLSGQNGDEIGSTKCIYWTGGYDFSFLKVDGFDEALGGAKFQLYTFNTNTNDYEPYKKGGEDVIAESSDGTNKTKFPDPEDNTKALEKGIVLFRKVAPKVYYMFETDPPEGYVTDTEEATTIYRVTVDPDGKLKIDKKLLSEDDGKYTEVYKVQIEEAEGDSNTESAEGTNGNAGAENTGSGSGTPGTENVKYLYHIMNTSTTQRKVILRKVLDGDYMPLSGLKFTLRAVDGTVIGEDLESTDSGVFYIGTLPYGLYYIDETDAGSYYQPDPEKGEYFRFGVNEKGVVTWEEAEHTYTIGDESVHELRLSEGTAITNNENAGDGTNSGNSQGGTNTGDNTNSGDSQGGTNTGDNTNSGDSQGGTNTGGNSGGSIDGGGSGSTGGDDTIDDGTGAPVTVSTAGPYKVDDVINVGIEIDGKVYDSSQYGPYFSITSSGGDIIFYNNNQGIKIMSSGEEVILTVTVITPIWDNDLQKTIPAGYSGTVTISVEKKDSGTATVSTMIDRTNVSLTIQHAAETEYTDGDIDAIIADGGFKKGLLYTIGSSVYFCYNSLTDPDTIRYNRQSGLLLLPEFSYSEGSLVYSGTPIDGSNPPFSAGRGKIVKQNEKYYIVCSTTWYYDNDNLDEETDAFYRII